MHILYPIPLLLILASLYTQADAAVNQDNLYLAKIRERHSNTWTGNLNITAGNSRFYSDNWGAADELLTPGFNFDIGKKSWLVNMAFNYRTGTANASDTTAAYDASLSAFDAGLRMYFEDPNLNWGAYFGTGLSLISTKIEAPAIGLSETGNEIGYWVNLGIFYRFHQTWNLGVEMRYSNLFVDTVDNANLNPNHYFYGLIAGYHW